MPAAGGQTAIVTGAAGFVGSQLVARLAREGWGVVATDLARPEDTARRAPSGAAERGLDVRDGEAVSALLAEVRPDVVFHLAAQASVAASMHDPLHDVAVNVLGTVHLARAAVASGVRRIVHFSTGGALYGEPLYHPVDEQHPARPSSVYGASKLAAELYLAALTSAGDTSLSVLRPGNIYGPGQVHTREYGVIGIFAGRMLRGESVTIFGDGEESRDYVFIDDVVDAALAAAQGSPATCLVGSGVATTTRRIFDLVAEATSYGRPPRYEPARPGEIRRIALSPRLAGERWGWRPETPLERGIALAVDWHRSRLRGAPGAPGERPASPR